LFVLFVPLSKTWTLRKQEIDRLNAFEMWIWRRMEKVSWVDKKTNQEKRSLLELVMKRKKNWIGYAVRGDGGC